MQSRDEQLVWRGDEATIEWLGSSELVAAFVFSEVPSWLGAIGEVIARGLEQGPARFDVHLWTRATPYQGDSGVPKAAWVNVESALLRALGIVGGGRALAKRLVELAPGRVRCDEPGERLEPEAGPFSEMLAACAGMPLRDVRYRGAEAGWAVYGSLATLTTSSFGTDFVPEPEIRLMLRSFAAVYDRAVATLRAERPAAVVIFNGRWLHEWATREAAESLGIPVVVLETGRDEDYFATYLHSAHDEAQYAQRMRFAWETRLGLSAQEATTLAHVWFTSRRASPASTNPYVTMQVPGELPISTGGRRRVVYYTSSSDEMLSSGRSWLSSHGSQEEIVERLVALAAADATVQLVIRIHPHTLMKNSRDRAYWSQLLEHTSDNVVVVPPDSSVDSYALAESAELVLSVGSTMGIEAAYWGVPSATLGPSLYDSLDVVTPVRELDRALHVRVQDDERRLRRTRALPWGFHQSTLGTRYRVFEPDPPLHRFAGTPLARRGALQRVIPAPLSSWRQRLNAARMRARWDEEFGEPSRPPVTD